MRTRPCTYRTDQGQEVAVPPGLSVSRAVLDKVVVEHMRRAGFVFPAYRLQAVTKDMEECGRFMEEYSDGTVLLDSTQVEPGLPSTALIRFLLAFGPALIVALVWRCLGAGAGDWSAIPWAVSAGLLSWVVFSAITPPDPNVQQ
ncbi:hypothetical protein [Luteolibacter sp. Populi]|uniref:hypothetical protein n=1 Tax=Luteolibacter sp. Populi TaxID=3230487 RepID=UPI003466EF43